MFIQSSHVPFSEEAPLWRIWIARRMSRLKRATAAALSHSPSCSRDFRKGSTSMSGPRLIQPHNCKARLRSSLWYRGTSVCLSEPDQHRRVSVVPERGEREGDISWEGLHWQIPWRAIEAFSRCLWEILVMYNNHQNVTDYCVFYTYQSWTWQCFWCLSRWATVYCSVASVPHFQCTAS